MTETQPIGAAIVSLKTKRAISNTPISLETLLAPGLKLPDPFMIGSSHHTDNENALASLSNYVPAAVTLKTISNRQGGSGVIESRKRERVQLAYPGGNRLGTFTDGPKKYELWDAPTALGYIQKARHYFPATKLGLSIAEGENYLTIAKSLDLSSISYVELNWKYSFRDRTFSDGAVLMRADLENFIQQFINFPILVKVPSELLPFLAREELYETYAFLAEHNCLLLVSNQNAP
jgi:dihydroorotate dehydrogenase